MPDIDSWIISIVTFFPLLGLLAILFVNKEQEAWIRRIGLFIAALNFSFSLHLFFNFSPIVSGMQFEMKILDHASGIERIPEWVPGLVKYHVGVDGISLFLVLLTTFLIPIVLLGSWTDVKHRVKEYVCSILLLETALVGVFVALDLVLFYVFWELVLIPMYLLIGVWGSHQKKNFFGIEMEGRIYSAVKFFLYTMVGSLLMLVAIVALYFMSPQRTFDFPTLQQAIQSQQLQLAGITQTLLFLAFALAFAIKVPMFPFHTWLPDAHVDAPTSGSVILAGVLLKMGTYGFLRFCIPLFPEAAETFIPIICALAVFGILYGALTALAQPDMKKLVAYSSVSHLGFVMLGLFVYKWSLEGMAGAVMQMINHGLSTGGLFLVVGMIYERRHTRLIRDFGGLAAVMPTFCVCFLIITLSSIGLPGLNGFVGEFLVLQGAMIYNFWFAAPAAIGVILGAIYMLRTFRSVMYGPLDKEENKNLPDLRPHELAALVPLIAMIFLIGLYPKPFLEKMEPSLMKIHSAAKYRRAEARLHPLPNDESLGYSQMSLRDKEGNTAGTEGRYKVLGASPASQRNTQHASRFTFHASRFTQGVNHAQ
jgi:NADH-quinone oxidoreductase subunit M